MWFRLTWRFIPCCHIPNLIPYWELDCWTLLSNLRRGFQMGVQGDGGVLGMKSGKAFHSVIPRQRLRGKTEPQLLRKANEWDAVWLTEHWQCSATDPIDVALCFNDAGWGVFFLFSFFLFCHTATEEVPVFKQGYSFSVLSRLGF